jgi:hypothetical protein
MTTSEDPRARLLKRLTTAWDELGASYAGLSEAELTEPGVMGVWSVKDILGHVATWEEEALKHLPTILAGGRPPRYVALGGIDAFNAQMQEQQHGLRLSDALQQLDNTHRRLIRFIQNVPEAELAPESRFRRRLRLDTYGHYPKHAAAIRDWRHQPPPGHSSL